MYLEFSVYALDRDEEGNYHPLERPSIDTEWTGENCSNYRVNSLEVDNVHKKYYVRGQSYIWG